MTIFSGKFLDLREGNCASITFYAKRVEKEPILPFRRADMALSVPFSHDVVSPAHGLGGSRTGETTLLFPNQRRNGRAFACLTARGGGLPIGLSL